MKKSTLFLIGMSAFLLIFAFASCDTGTSSTSPGGPAPAVMYTVTYNGNGNTGGTVPEAWTQAKSSDQATIPGPGNLVKTGEYFAGWNTKADGSGTKFSVGQSYKPKADITLYVEWSTDPLYTIKGKISTDNNNADVSAASIQLKDKTSTDFGNAITPAANGNYTIYGVPADTGYTIEVSLAGYVTKTIIAFPVSDNVTGKDTTLISLANARFTITYNGNDNTSAANTVPAVWIQTTSSTEATILAEPKGTGGDLAKTSNYFAGWNTKADGSGTKLSSGQSYTPTGDITLYAEWSSTALYTVKGTISVIDSTTTDDVSGATIQLKTSAGAAVGNAIHPAADGTYTIYGVAAANGYTIAVSFTGYADDTITSVDVSGAVTGKDSTLEGPYTISGVVKKLNDSDAIAGASIQLVDSSTNNYGTAVTSAVSTGAYSITGVKAGTYTVVVSNSNTNGWNTANALSIVVTTGNKTQNLNADDNS